MTKKWSRSLHASVPPHGATAELPQVSSSSSMSPPMISDTSVLFFLLLDDWALGVVLDGLVRLHVLGRLRLLALSFCVGFLERDQLGPLNLLGLDLWLPRRRSFIGARSRGHRNDLKRRAAFRARDRGLVQVVELCAATGAEAFATKLGFRHRVRSLKTGLLEKGSPLCCPRSGCQQRPAARECAPLPELPKVGSVDLRTLDRHPGGAIS